jgi:hypothetical protein
VDRRAGGYRRVAGKCDEAEQSTTGGRQGGTAIVALGLPGTVVTMMMVCGAVGMNVWLRGVGIAVRMGRAVVAGEAMRRGRAVGERQCHGGRHDAERISDGEHDRCATAQRAGQPRQYAPRQHSRVDILSSIRLDCAYALDPTTAMMMTEALTLSGRQATFSNAAKQGHSLILVRISVKPASLRLTVAGKQQIRR